MAVLGEGVTPARWAERREKVGGGVRGGQGRTFFVGGGGGVGLCVLCVWCARVHVCVCARCDPWVKQTPWRRSKWEGKEGARP